MLTKIGVVCVLLLSFIDDLKCDKCLTTTKHFYKKFSTKTPYQYIVDGLGRKGWRHEKECEDRQVWSIIRHGTRYPSKKAIRYITQDVLEIRDRIVRSPKTKLCKDDIKNLKSWNLSVDASLKKDLHKEGIEELIFLGERMLDRHPSLLQEYHHSHYIFRATDTQRALVSGESFALGMFSRPMARKVKFQDPIKPHDPLIRGYKLCKKWLREVKKNTSSREEFYKFSESSHIQEIRRNMTELLGLEEELTVEDLDKMYVSCNFDQAWAPRKLSPWCALFSDKSLEAMEYREDLEYYWIDGPGHEISYAPSCVLLQNIFHNFRNATQGLPEEKGIFYFTHSGTLLKLLAYLGTHQDSQHLTSDNYLQMRNRKWRTSNIGPFASNVYFLLRNCSGAYSVCLFVNEKQERIPGCKSKCCSWEDFTHIFQSKVEACDPNSLCENSQDDESISAPDDRF